MQQWPKSFSCSNIWQVKWQHLNHRSARTRKIKFWGLEQCLINVSSFSSVFMFDKWPDFAMTLPWHLFHSQWPLSCDNNLFLSVILQVIIVKSSYWRLPINFVIYDIQAENFKWSILGIWLITEIKKKK